MAMTLCEKCGQAYNESEVKCPNCGHEPSQNIESEKENAAHYQLYGVVALVLLAVIAIAAVMITVSITGNGKSELVKWEYKAVTQIGVSMFNDSRDIAPRSFDNPESMLRNNGDDGWELVAVQHEIETIHPNFGNEKYVTGLQPNTRTSKITYIFKRPKQE